MYLAYVADSSAKILTGKPLVCGTVGAKIQIVYSDEWLPFTKTVCFSNGEVQKDDVSQNEIVEIPHEVLSTPYKQLRVGFYGSKNGVVVKTIWVDLGYILNGPDPCGDESAKPILPVYSQILEMIGDLDLLETDCRDNLVCAINSGLRMSWADGTPLKFFLGNNSYISTIPIVSGQMLFDTTNKALLIDFDGARESFGAISHNRLSGRDEPNQHPITSITGLEEALSGKQPSGDYLTKETDPSVPDWAKQPTKPDYTPDEVGSEPVGTSATMISSHNVSNESHSDIRLLVRQLTDRLNTIANSDDVNLDQLQEIVSYIKANRGLIEQVTTGKIGVSDIVDNLTTNVAEKPLSAAMGVELKRLVDTSYDKHSSEIQKLNDKIYLNLPSINQYDWNRSDDSNLVPYYDKQQKFVVSVDTVNSVIVPVSGGKIISVERISGARFTITQLSVYPAKKAAYLASQDFHGKTKVTITTEAETKYLLISMRHDSDKFTFDDAKQSLKVYYGSDWNAEGRTKFDDLYQKVDALESETYLRKIPDYAMKTLAYKPLGVLSKGYICLSCDDGANTLATYTIPMLKQKNVPCTFGLMSDSKVMENPEYVSLIKDMVKNNKCSVAQHGRDSFTSYTETQLVSFLDSERAKFKQQGIEVEGAICPNHDYNDLVSAVVGGKYGVVCTGGTNKPVYYSHYTLGPRSNLYALYRASVQSITLDKLKAAIDAAYADHYIYMPFWHDNAFASDPAQQEKLEAMIDYAKSKGIAFCTVGDIEKLL